MSENNKGGRLPPPAFPPGTRKRPGRPARDPDSVAGSIGPEGASGDDAAFISPDDPMPDRRDSVERAFISPDEPMPERQAGLNAAMISPDDPMPTRDESRGLDDAAADVGVVTGMGLDPRVKARDLAAGNDPNLAALIGAVSRFAEALRQRGEAGLRTTPEMTRFEATMRSYCVGYLRGRRVEEEPPPVIRDDHLPSDY